MSALREATQQVCLYQTEAIFTSMSAALYNKQGWLAAFPTPTFKKRSFFLSQSGGEVWGGIKRTTNSPGTPISSYIDTKLFSDLTDKQISTLFEPPWLLLRNCLCI